MKWRFKKPEAIVHVHAVESLEALKADRLYSVVAGPADHFGVETQFYFGCRLRRDWATLPILRLGSQAILPGREYNWLELPDGRFAMFRETSIAEKPRCRIPFGFLFKRRRRNRYRFLADQ